MLYSGSSISFVGTNRRSWCVCIAGACTYARARADTHTHHVDAYTGREREQERAADDHLLDIQGPFQGRQHGHLRLRAR